MPSCVCGRCGGHGTPSPNPAEALAHCSRAGAGPAVRKGEPRSQRPGAWSGRRRPLSTWTRVWPAATPFSPRAPRASRPRVTTLTQNPQ